MGVLKLRREGGRSLRRADWPGFEKTADRFSDRLHNFFFFFFQDCEVFSAERG